MEDIMLMDNGLLIALACLILGSFIKGSTKIHNKYIPYINVVFSIILGFVIPETYTDRSIASKIIILILLGLSSVGLYEAICVIVKKRFSVDLKDIFLEENKEDELANNDTEFEEDNQTDETDSQEKYYYHE